MPRARVEQIQFDDCYEYSDDRSPVPIDCSVVLQNKVLFLVLVLALIGAGIAALVRARGADGIRMSGPRICLVLAVQEI